MFRKFWHLQPRPRWDGTVDAAMMFHDAEWLQIDSSITSWLYNNISSVLMTMVQVPEPTAYTLQALPQQRHAMRSLRSQGIPQPLSR
jgi:hypothetical protein